MPSYDPSSTMKALVYHGPHDIRIENKPIPKILKPTDAIVKITGAALCGSDLHPYRGSTTPKPGYIMGHEALSVVVAVGDKVKNFKVGDEVLSVFTTQCGDCFYCKNGVASKCAQSVVFGTTALDGLQAEYSRIPLADSTLLPRPRTDDKGEPIEETKLALMCDIFPTAYYGVSNLLRQFSGIQKIDELVLVQFGSGPVGLCAVAIAKSLGVENYFVVDCVDERLEIAKKFGAIPLNFKKVDVLAEVQKFTDNRGADGVLEVVGSQQALADAFKVVRCGGAINSIGYQHSPFSFTGLDCYMKNITLQFGRCPAYSVYNDALKIFKKVHHLLDGFVDLELPLVDAVKGYELFDKQAARKIIFRPHDLKEPIKH